MATTSTNDKRIEDFAASVLRASYHREIERAICNVKRSEFDKWFRCQWYRAVAKSRRNRLRPTQTRQLKSIGLRHVRFKNGFAHRSLRQHAKYSDSLLCGRTAIKSGRAGGK